MEKLEVGMSCDVVIITCDLEYPMDTNLFKVGGFTIKTGNLALLNGESDLFKHSENQKLFISNTRCTKVGKLTIKSLK